MKQVRRKSLGHSSVIAELEGELQKKDQMIQRLNEQINHFISEIAEPAEPAGVDDEAFRALREMHTEGVSEEHVKEVFHAYGWQCRACFQSS